MKIKSFSKYIFLENTNPGKECICVPANFRVTVSICLYSWHKMQNVNENKWEHQTDLINIIKETRQTEDLTDNYEKASL